MGKINILYYEPSSGFGGSARCLRDWLLKLNRNKFQPSVAVLDDGPAIKKIKDLGKESEFDVVSLIEKKSKANLVFTPALIHGYWKLLIHIARRVLPVSIKLAIYNKKNRIDLVHINTPIITGLEAIIAAKINNIPCICHIHDTHRWSRLERVMVRWVSKVICLTDEAMKLYQEYVDKNKLHRIYNGIDVGKSVNKVDIKKEFGIAGDDKIVGIVGRITGGKGHDIFLKAARLISANYPDTKFLIVGDILTEGEKGLKNSLLNLAAELDIADKVIFAGWREDALNIISNMDVLVQASDTFPEGFGLTCIEAMSLGVPVVVTNIPGPSEIVRNNETGFIVPPGRPEPMAEAIANIMKDDDLASRFAKAGMKRTKELFDLNQIVRQIENVYLELVQR